MQVDENAGKEKKELNRIMYIENNKETALIAKKVQELPFTEKSEVKSPMKKKKLKNQKKEIIPPSETYL